MVAGNLVGDHRPQFATRGDCEMDGEVEEGALHFDTRHADQRAPELFAHRAAIERVRPAGTATVASSVTFVMPLLLVVSACAYAVGAATSMAAFL